MTESFPWWTTQSNCLYRTIWQQAVSIPAKTGEELTFGWGAIESWWLLREKESVFLMSVVLSRLPMSQWMTHTHVNHGSNNWMQLVIKKKRRRRERRRRRRKWSWFGGEGGKQIHSKYILYKCEIIKYQEHKMNCTLNSLGICSVFRDVIGKYLRRGPRSNSLQGG